MAESQKGTSSAADLKKKSQQLDEAIGDEFLNTWKTSLPEDQMDFSFESFDAVKKGKNKAFEFDKLDMEFNLDKNFEKLSSFKLDIPDFDFSCLSKKTANLRCGSEEQSAKENGLSKRDSLSFSLDFDEFDGFQFGKSLVKKERNSKVETGKTAVSSDVNENQGPKIDMVEGVGRSSDCKAKATSTSENVPAPVFEASVGGRCDQESAKFDSTSDEAKKSEQLTAVASEAEQGERNYSPEKETLTLQTMHGDGTQSVGRNDSNDISIPDVMKVCSLGTKLSNNAGLEKNAIDILGSYCKHNSFQPVNFGPESISSEVKKSVYATTEVVDGVVESEGDLPLAADTAIDCSLKVMRDVRGMGEDDKSASTLQLTTIDRDATIDKVLVKGKESSGICVKISQTSEVSESLSRQPTRTGFHLLHRKTAEATSESSAARKGSLSGSKEALMGCKLAGNTTSVTRELMECGFAKVEDKKISSNLRDVVEDCSPGYLRRGFKPVIKSLLRDFEVTKGEHIGLRSDRNSTGVSPLSGSEQVRPLTSETLSRLNSLPLDRHLESSRSSTQVSNGLCPTKAKAKLADLSLKISRGNGGQKIAAICGGSKMMNSGSSGPKVGGVQCQTASDLDHCAQSSEKQLVVPSTKRKTSEVSQTGSMSDLALLKPLKRLSGSSNDIRTLKHTSEKIVDEKEKHVESKVKDVSHDQPTSRCGSPQTVNMKELEIPLAIENDENVEKAEAYTKQLEDICNMLRKKHEEAKEILVRAVVNNNYLLMLDHPIYQEKIQKVQKFATRLQQGFQM